MSRHWLIHITHIYCSYSHKSPFIRAAASAYLHEITEEVGKRREQVGWALPHCQQEEVHV